MNSAGYIALDIAPQIWILMFSLAGFMVEYALCKRQYSKKLVITLTNRLKETFNVDLGADRFEIATEVKWSWRCRKDLLILHKFCTACAWHGKFEEYYEDENT